MIKQSKNLVHLLEDGLIFAASIAFAVWLSKSGIVMNLLATTDKTRLVTIFLAGIFYSSLFTAAPATVVLAQLAKTSSIWTVGLLGALGAMTGDLLIFRFIKNSVGEDIKYLSNLVGWDRFTSFFHLKVFRFVSPIAGALMIASPFLPDEIGVALLGLFRVRTIIFTPLAFGLHFIGITLVSLLKNIV